MTVRAAEAPDSRIREQDVSGGPIAECLACGHILPLAVWKAGTEIGICAACRNLAEPNRGPCSHARGCRCPCPACKGDPEWREWRGVRVGPDAGSWHGCSHCHGFGTNWGSSWDPLTNTFAEERG